MPRIRTEPICDGSAVGASARHSHCGCWIWQLLLLGTFRTTPNCGRYHVARRGGILATTRGEAPGTLRRFPGDRSAWDHRSTAYGSRERAGCTLETGRNDDVLLLLLTPSV